MTLEEAQKCKDLIKNGGPLCNLLDKLHLHGMIGNYDCGVIMPKDITTDRFLPGARLIVEYWDPRNEKRTTVMDHVFTAPEFTSNVFKYVPYGEFCDKIETAVKKIFIEFPA